MRIQKTAIDGVCIVENDTFRDSRGAFSRLFCARGLAEVLGSRSVVQINFSQTSRVGAIRGMHFQYSPYAEMKVVRCLAGRVFDVAVDLRLGSPTLLAWMGLELAAGDGRALVIPEGCAHGFQVLQPNSELLYIHTAYYMPQFEGGVQVDDPRINIKWPLAPTDLSAKDRTRLPLPDTFKGIDTRL
jgi:dTDP-4-dehydrorhamnose 3,5-epimerase